MIPVESITGTGIYHIYAKCEFRWLQYTPLTFITKLNIELSMADLLMKLATQKHTIEAERELADRQLAESGAPTKSANDSSTQPTAAAIEMGRMGADDNWQWAVLRTQEVVMDVERAAVIASSGRASTAASGSDNDEQPLRRDWERVGYHGSTLYRTEVKTATAQTGEEQ